MSKLKPALVFVAALSLFVFVCIELLGLYEAFAALSLFEPVRFWVI